MCRKEGVRRWGEVNSGAWLEPNFFLCSQISESWLWVHSGFVDSALIFTFFCFSSLMFSLKWTLCNTYQTHNYYYTPWICCLVKLVGDASRCWTTHIINEQEFDPVSWQIEKRNTVKLHYHCKWADTTIVFNVNANKHLILVILMESSR